MRPIPPDPDNFDAMRQRHNKAVVATSAAVTFGLVFGVSVLLGASPVLGILLPVVGIAMLAIAAAMYFSKTNQQLKSVGLGAFIGCGGVFLMFVLLLVLSLFAVIAINI